MIDQRGMLRADLTSDGLHPLAQGYALMAPIAEAAIDSTLAARHRAGRTDRPS
jgi:lysophospholipase L1-like esterase